MGTLIPNPDPCVVTASHTPNAHESVIATQLQYPAQVFTPELGVDHPFVTLDLSECPTNGPADAQQQIVAAPGGVPDWGNPLETAVVPASRIRDACVGGIFGAVVFGFPSVELAAGTQYAVVLQAGAISWRYSAMPEDAQNPYPGGNFWIYSDGQSMEGTDNDLQFWVCGAANTSDIREPGAAVRQVRGRLGRPQRLRPVSGLRNLHSPLVRGQCPCSEDRNHSEVTWGEDR